MFIFKCQTQDVGNTDEDSLRETQQCDIICSCMQLQHYPSWLKCSQLSIQNMIGGGRPAGGRHGSTKDTPSWTTIGLIFSFDHKGDPGSVGEGYTHQWMRSPIAWHEIWGANGLSLTWWQRWRGKMRGMTPYWITICTVRGENTKGYSLYLLVHPAK